MIALDIEDAIGSRSIVFEGDLRGQFEKLFLGKSIAQSRIKIVINVRRSRYHCISEFNYQKLFVVKH